MSKLMRKALDTLKTNGIKEVWNKTFHYIRRSYTYSKQAKGCNDVVDIIFINGCDDMLPHPTRYRVFHQMEQLQKNNVSCSQLYYKNLNIEHLKYASGFVFFRCPYTETIGEFIELAKQLNKVVLYDVDDLVIDTKYTNQIPYVKNMTFDEKECYDANVLNMKKLLRMCDGAITTTEALADELHSYVENVYINRNTASDEMVKLSNLASREKYKDKVTIGYFSGSITHNDDFEIVIPVLLRLFEKYKTLQLLIVGELDIPKELEKYRERVVAKPFMDWKKLPEIISHVDINIAPIRCNIFNEAKSENKWVEAALVKVPTVASKVGAFETMIENGNTGILCETNEDWFHAIDKLISDSELRKDIGNRAYEYVVSNCTTTSGGQKLVNNLKKYKKNQLLFILPSEEISGGIMVAIRHAIILQEAGFDVSFMIKKPQNNWLESFGYRFPIIDCNINKFKAHYDKAVATMWTTVEPLLKMENVDKKFYLVQNYEPDFYEKNSLYYKEALQTYSKESSLNFVTISRWCQTWLEEKFNKEVKYGPNGIDLEYFNIKERTFDSKVRILIEGDSEASHKNIDESFLITNELDRDKFEVWYMSYKGKVKPWYICDKKFYNIPYEKVGEIYSQCDILLKSSKLESFSYPPLEMMATGGFVVVAPNDGNIEYLKDRYNCLMYQSGDVKAARECIIEICENPELRRTLFGNSIKTVNERDWKLLSNQISDLYI